MKFVLDENVFYHAVYSVDEHGESDKSARELIYLIVKNCHAIVADRRINKLFGTILEQLRGQLRLKEQGKIDTGTEKFIKTLAHIISNSQKYLFVKYEADDLNFEEHIQNIPRKDKFVVKLSIKERVNFIVTADNELYESINNNPYLKSKKITALQTKNAIEKAKEKCKEDENRNHR